MQNYTRSEWKTSSRVPINGECLATAPNGTEYYKAVTFENLKNLTQSYFESKNCDRSNTPTWKVFAEKNLHSKRVEKMRKLHSKRVEKMRNYTRNESKIQAPQTDYVLLLDHCYNLDSKSSFMWTVPVIFSTRFECSFTSSPPVSSEVLHLPHSVRV